MDFSKKQPALLYLDVNGFYFYESGTSSVVSMGFLPESVKDMDVINPTTLENQVKAFIEQGKITPCNISIILSPNLIFEKEILVTDVEKQKVEIAHYLDNLPFENVASSDTPLEKGVKVFAVNEELFTSLHTAFSKFGSAVENVILYSSLGNDAQLINNLTPENANLLIKKMDKLKQLSLLKQRPKTTPTPEQKPTEATAKKKQSPRIYVMAVFLLVLLGILGYMLLTLK